MSRDRDKIVEDALKHQLRRTTSSQGNACLDAEMLAAWEDGGLDATTMAAMETHVSGCSRCQELVALTLKANPTQAAVVEADAAQDLESRSAWAFWKWMAPLAAGAAAVTIWMVVPEQQEIAVAPPQPAATEMKAETANPAAPQTPPPPPSTPADTLADAQKKAAPNSNSLESRQSAKKAESADQARVDATAKELNEEPPAARPAAAAEPATAAAPSPPISALKRSQAIAGPLEIVSPDPSRRWRISQDSIEVSSDSGLTWSLVAVFSETTLTAGTSPSRDVCWLIGTRGEVLLTTDGARFDRVEIRNAGTLRSISASDARSATVVNAAGRSFRTDDGGRTWR